MPHGATFWWIAAGLLVAVELSTGTFYLLMLALGAAAAALGAHLGLGLSSQITLAALVGGAAVALWHRRRARRPQQAAESNPDVNLDIGQTVLVEQWGPDGHATVKYRGAEWQVRYRGSDRPEAGRYVIRAVEGSCLLLDR
ncbi:NfeD family protein [Roseateles sp. DAIF2]|nr:NfeD family protein [Roseateles sp. DAIF2]